MEARRSDSHTTEITLISAENLCMNGKPIKKDLYVVVHTQSRAKFFTTRTTTQGEDGSKNPCWNQKFSVEGANCITFEVQRKTWLGVRSVGTARIALADFLGGFLAQNSVQFLSYRLWDENGQRNGVINFSVRVLKPQPCSVAMAANDSSRIVTGIPLFWNFPLNVPT
ncbi:BON1-associated protein 2, partial [Mucuna pruriens]